MYQFRVVCHNLDEDWASGPAGFSHLSDGSCCLPGRSENTAGSGPSWDWFAHFWFMKRIHLRSPVFEFLLFGQKKFQWPQITNIKRAICKNIVFLINIHNAKSKHHFTKITLIPKKYIRYLFLQQCVESNTHRSIDSYIQIFLVLSALWVTKVRKIS